MKRKVINIPIYNHKVTLLQGDLNSILTYLSHIYTRDIESQVDIS